MMNKSILSVVVLGMVAVSAAVAQIPPGFEVVQITNDPDYDGPPKINNCGEIVFATRINQSGQLAEIFVYDNGRITQLTDDYVPDAYPDINDAGTVVWTRYAGDYGANTIVMFPPGGQMTTVGFGSSPEINNLGHVAWKVFDPTPCASPSAIFFYDGETVEQITDDGLSNNLVALNDKDEVVWNQRDYCSSPWEYRIMRDVNGITEELTDSQSFPNVPHVNNLGQVVWQFQLAPGAHAIQLWENGQTTLLTDWGSNPRLNDVGDMYFIRWHEDTSTWQAWLCLHCLQQRDGQPTFLQLTDDPFWNTDGDINDDGEIAWQSGGFPVADILYLRRIRNGDADANRETDLDDFSILQRCLTGPGETDRLCECRFVDLDHDGDVDVRDFSTFQNLYTAQQ